MRIRPLKPSDLPYFNIPSFPLDTRMWIYEKRTPFAYAGYSIAPGLPYLADLYIYVMPAYRRKGYGSTLLKHVFGHIKDVSVTLLSSPVNHIKSPSARFLKGHGFEIEHVELELVCDLAQATFSADPALSPNVGNRAAELMRQLYDDSFGPMPWYQPYEDADEILDDLGTDGEILLWRSDNIPIGFAGIRYVNSHRTGLVA
ncbi:MAG: GNAT family N-acetyltransferase, partial [Candidatus Promineifilaceae bacterium]